MGTAKSAWSTIAQIENVPAGQHPMVQRFMKAVFNERPTFAKTTVMWDVDQVLNNLHYMGMPGTQALPQLTQKLCMMLLILSGQRGLTLHALDTVNMTLD